MFGKKSNLLSDTASRKCLRNVRKNEKKWPCLPFTFVIIVSLSEQKT